MKTKSGEVVLGAEIPQCNFCSEPGPYDFRTIVGPWANGCEEHWRAYRAEPGLDVGVAQLWITEES
jgi:hypothetical protein